MFEHLTPERKAKGDLDYSEHLNGSIRYAQVADARILADLVRRRRLADYAPHYALVYETWRSAFLAPVDCIRVSALQVPLGEPGPYTKADKYAKLMRALPVHLFAVVNVAIHPNPTQADRSKSQARPDLFKEAFDALAAAIDSIEEMCCA